MRNLFISIISIIILIACAHPAKEALNPDEKESLSKAIVNLSASISPGEANQTSRILLATTSELAHEYEMVSPAKYHNLLVNLGLRKRGLCCHWAEDLHAKLRKSNPYSIQFEWVVTRHGNMLREHNSVIIYAANSSWENGLIFDPWRTAGQPFWVPIADDKYKWMRHPLSGQWDQLHCE